jgi:CRP-like cAMP-binding protein
MSSVSLAVETPHPDLGASLAAVVPFDGLPPPVLAAVGAVAQLRAYLAGECLYALGQFDGSEFFVVLKGRLKAAYADGPGGAMLIEDVREGGIFGLADALADDENKRAETLTLTADRDCEILAVEAAAFRELVAQRPSLARNLLTYLARALVRAGASVAPEDISPERRVFAALLAYVTRDPVSGEWRIERMPRHRELADRAGADEAVAASAVASLIQAGIARRDYPGLVVVDMAQLNRLAH